MKNKKILGIGIVGGASGIAGVHLSAYELVGNNKIVAICDTNTSKGIEVAKKYGAFFTDNYEEMLNYPGIDIKDEDVISTVEVLSSAYLSNYLGEEVRVKRLMETLPSQNREEK